jgi:hypothetical protein
MNRTFAILSAAAVVFAVSPPSPSFGGRFAGVVRLASGATPRASAATPLSGAEIQARLIGNTITGVENGEAYEEYLKPDGTISGIEDSGFYSGSWRIVNNKLCFHYDEDDGDGKGWDCTPVTLVGTNVYWSNEVSDGDSVEATLLPGNPKNL